jgi:hypothetical protein
MRKKYLVVAILLLVAGAAAFLWRPIILSSRPGTPLPPPLPPVSQPEKSSVTQSHPATAAPGNGANPSAGDLSAKAGELPPPPPVETNVPPMMILQNAHRAIVQYAQVYGGNPVGVNSEITAALTGNNPKGINFITPDSGLNVNTNGEMVDAWGTPLFFHQLSAHDMEIHSAGEDRKMWTLDDLVIH